jgi:hypothetical protein
MIRSFCVLSILVVAACAEDTSPALLSDWLAKMRSIVPRGYVCPRAAKAVTVDGKLDDAAWVSAPWTEDFVDIEGDAKPKPHLRTRAKMLWDEDYFYVAAELEEPHVWGTMTQHDTVIFNDPDFEVFLDPNGDSHEYYEFEMNALNTGWDLFLPKPYKDGGQAQNSWEIPGLKTAVHVAGTINNPVDQDEGWSLEVAFPWKALAQHAHRPVPPQEGDQWRVGFSRVEWEVGLEDGKYVKVPKTPEQNWIWSAQGVVDMHRPERWGFVQFTRRTSEFVRDPSAPARDALQTVYYAQKDYFAKHRQWATDLEELSSLNVKWPTGVTVPVLRPTADGYVCAATLTSLNGKTQRWTIRQDALIKPADEP